MADKVCSTRAERGQMDYGPARHGTAGRGMAWQGKAR